MRLQKHSGRRKFLQTASGFAIPTVIPGSALGLGNRPAPSQRVNMAFIGLGGRGIGVMEAFLKHADVQGVAVCDVHDRHYRDQAWGVGREFGRLVGKQVVDQTYGNQDCAAYTDFRELLASDDLDAVLVATPDHWHAVMTLAALRSGRDVYCEKPVTHLFAEGQAVYREAAIQNAVFQVGSQQRSEPEFRRAVEVVRNGHLGAIERVEVGLPPCHSTPQGDPTVTAPPIGLDYDLWCGPSPQLPYMRARHHRSWRYHSSYGGGTLMDWIGHHNDIAHWGLGVQKSGPIRVEARGWTWPKTEIYDTAVDFEITCEYAKGAQSTISSKHPLGVKWIGENGWVWVTRGELEASDPAWIRDDFQRGKWRSYRSLGHQRNFIDCVKRRRRTASPAEAGHRSITPGHLGLVSASLGRALRWDPNKETILDDSEAQAKLMECSYREPWVL